MASSEIYTLSLRDALPIYGPGSNYKYLDTRTFNNAGVGVWSSQGTAYDISMLNGAAFNNSGSFDLQNDRNFLPGVGTLPAFNNSGTFTKSLGSGSNSNNIN